MATKPHLSQIQSSNPEKYDHLLDEIIDINSSIAEIDTNIDNLYKLGFKAIVETYNDLINLNDKKVGFYLVKQDENYRNNPTHYYYNGNEFKMVGGRVPEGVLKKTVVFYVKRYNEKGQKMNIYVPYKGYINSITASNPQKGNLKFRLWDNSNLIGEFEVNEEFKEWIVYYTVNNPLLQLELLGEEIGLGNININLDIIIED